MADFRYLLEIDPEYTDAHVNLAGLFADLGDSEAAGAVVVDGLEVAPDNPHLHCLRGRLDLEAGNTPAARAALDLAIAADPTLAGAWALRGMPAYTEEGAGPQAIGAFSRALELKPDPAVFFTAARCIRSRGNGNWQRQTSPRPWTWNPRTRTPGYTARPAAPDSARPKQPKRTSGTPNNSAANRTPNP